MFFILVAVTFPIGFIADLFKMRGHLMTATFEDMIYAARSRSATSSFHRPSFPSS